MTATRIGLLIFDGAEELDFVGPYEVFTMARSVLGDEESGLEVLLISEDGNAVTCAKGMPVGAQSSVAEAPALDVICVPGGQGTRRVIKHQPLLDWIAATAKNCRWVTSVCTGAFVLSAAGLTKDRKITTHWAAMEEFERLGLVGELQRGPRYVRDGNLVTAAGVSAGIDMALWLTGQLYGVDCARETQRYMEYDPAPPYSADV